MKCTSAKATFQQAPRQVRYVSITPDALNRALIDALKARTVERNFSLIIIFCSRVQRKVVCNAEGLKAFVKNASQQAAVLAASTLIAGVS